MDLSDYPPETRARAALRLTEEWHERALAGPVEGETQAHAERRANFLRVRPAVVRVAARCVHPNVEAIEALLRIVMVSPEVFARVCAEVDAGERAAHAEAEAFMATLRSEVRTVLRDAVEADCLPTMGLGKREQACEDLAGLRALAKRQPATTESGPFWALLDSPNDPEFDPDDEPENPDEQSQSQKQRDPHVFPAHA